MNAGRPPDFERYRQVLRWIEAGKTRHWIAEKLGLKLSSTRHLISRAEKWQVKSGLTETTRSVVNESLTRDEVLKVIDVMITDGLKVQADVVKDALAETRGSLGELSARVSALASEQAGALASTRDSLAELAMRVRDLAKGQTELLRRLDSLAERPAEVERSADAAPVTAKNKRPSSEAPPALWLWIVNECVRQIGMAGVVDQLEVSESLVNQWLRGTTPSSRQRDDLKRLLATIWARDDLFDDVDDLLDARDRLPTAQNAEAV